MRQNKLRTLLIFFSAFASVYISSQTLDTEAETGHAEIEQVVVVGSRHEMRTPEEGLVPVDIISREQLTSYGTGDMDDMLRAAIPAYALRTEAISDTGTFIRPANLRHQSPDSTLILVNEKRRHRGSVILWNAWGINSATHGPDVSSIPAIALERVEVLRDSASSQYGSDAIAGVINFQLRTESQNRELRFQTGQYSLGDGLKQSLQANWGTSFFGQDGFINLSAEVGYADPTDRSVQRTDALDLIQAGNTHVRQPHAQIWGSPTLHDDQKVLYNAEWQLSDTVNLYSFANVSSRDVEGGFFFRNPTVRSGIFSNDGGSTLLVADFTPDDDTACPTVRIVNHVPDPVALAQIKARQDCFTYNERFPGGFTPTFQGLIDDRSFAIGLRGDLDDIAYDLSFASGNNRGDFYLHNTINPQLAEHQLDVPTDYYTGSYVQDDWTANFEISTSYQTGIASEPTAVSLGLEKREERFEIIAGERNSYYISETLSGQEFGIGSNGFPGFRPDHEVDATQEFQSVWFDIEQRFDSAFTATLAVRWDDFDTYDSHFTGKVAARLELNETIALRGSIGTGFRVPSTGQAVGRTVVTSWVRSDRCPIGCLGDRATLPPTNPISRAKGGKPLTPERSNNLLAGIVWSDDDVSFTADLYRIQVDDRIGQTSEFIITQSEIEALLEQGVSDANAYSAIQFLTNAFDTSTIGLDLSASFRLADRWQISANANFGRTTVDSYDTRVVNDVRARQIEDSLPKVKLVTSVRRQFDLIDLKARVNYVGSVWEPHLLVGQFAFDIEPMTTVDLEVTTKFPGHINLTVGASNLLDATPTTNPHATLVGAKYPILAPMGINGGFFYLRLTLSD